MNEADASLFELEDLKKTVEGLLALGRHMGEDKAPRTPYDLFLREGGLDALDFIQFVAAVEKTFRIVLPFEYAGDWPNVAELAKDMHSGRHRRWR